MNNVKRQKQQALALSRKNERAARQVRKEQLARQHRARQLFAEARFGREQQTVIEDICQRTGYGVHTVNMWLNAHIDPKIYRALRQSTLDIQHDMYWVWAQDESLLDGLVQLEVLV